MSADGDLKIVPLADVSVDYIRGLSAFNEVLFMIILFILMCAWRNI